MRVTLRKVGQKDQEKEDQVLMESFEPSGLKLDYYNMMVSLPQSIRQGSYPQSASRICPSYMPSDEYSSVQTYYRIKLVLQK